jgi:hypothetical protein
MGRFTRALLATFGFVLLGLFIIMVPQKNALGQGGAPVVVQNTPLPIAGTVNITNNPLPVNLTNTPLPVSGNVNVTNASLPVTGTVTANINSLPNVNATITNSPLSALITNPMTNPVITQNVDNAARNSFAAEQQCNFSTTTCTINPLYLVPAGKIAVLTTISSACVLRLGDTLVDVQLRFVAPLDPSTDRQIDASMNFTPGPGNALFGGQQIIFTQSLNVYAWSSPNTPRIVPTPFPVLALFVSATDQTNSGATCDVSLFGHLVSEPQIP